MEKELTPPKEVYATVTLTHKELLRILWLYGTSVAVRTMEVYKSGVTCHTDAFVVSMAHKELDNVVKGFYYDKK